jgi:exonuclease III
MKKYSIDLLLLQETHITTSQQFLKDGFQILYSGNSSESHAGVGFIIAPWARHFAFSFCSHSARCASLKLRAQPRTLHIINVYAPSQVSDPTPDKERKTSFWDKLVDLAQTISPNDFPLFAGDFNTRLQCRPLTHPVHVGPHVCTCEECR